MPVIRPVDNLPAGPVVVTGAARGIGREVARLLAAAGVPVGLIDRDTEQLEQAAGEIRAGTDATVMSAGCDVSDESALATAFEVAVSALGAPHGVVASAGVDRGGLVHELEPGDFDAVLAVNLRGTFLTCRESVRYMLESGGGSIVCISSPFAFVAGPGGTGAYSASKAGVSALVRSLAVDYAGRGVRVNAVLPGPTETELMWANVPDDQVDAVRATVRDEVPLGRLADPGEPARAAIWLLSEAASFVTGSQLACDGGVLAKASISV